MVERTIPSYGIILFCMHKGLPHFLLYKRRDSYGYMDFLRGKWTERDILSLFSLMTNDERDRLQKYSFEELWKDLWMDDATNNINVFHFSGAKAKFETVKKQIPFYIKNTISVDEETLWGFPKGKKNQGESEIECALREFSEETKISKKDIKLWECPPFKEYYRGSDNKMYSTHYYLAETKNLFTPIYALTPDLIRKRTISEEADDFKWAPYSDIGIGLTSKRKDILKRILRIFSERYPQDSPFFG